jgi:hypothetical protein
MEPLEISLQVGLGPGAGDVCAPAAAGRLHHPTAAIVGARLPCPAVATSDGLAARA